MTNLPRLNFFKMTEKPNFFILMAMILIGSSNRFSAQNEFKNWYFGNFAGLSFTTSPPTIQTNCAINLGTSAACISDNSGVYPGNEKRGRPDGKY